MQLWFHPPSISNAEVAAPILTFFGRFSVVTLQLFYNICHSFLNFTVKIFYKFIVKNNVKK